MVRKLVTTDKDYTVLAHSVEHGVKLEVKHISTDRTLTEIVIPIPLLVAMAEDAQSHTKKREEYKYLA